jgi:hypothetical protein
MKQISASRKARSTKVLATRRRRVASASENGEN